MGVFYLGCIAFDAVKPQLNEINQKENAGLDINEVEKLFRLSCLLHDIGHAPFSHTGEAYYLDKSETLYKLLKEVVADATFSTDFDSLGTKKPAPHECMSCIVGIKTFSHYFGTNEARDIFSRCILGMQIGFPEKKPIFEMQMNEEEKKEATRKRKLYNEKKARIQLLNCIICLLNSSIIDVDRLDYIIRDAATIGFKSVQVDYARLLNGIRIVKYEEKYCLGYHKSALSVIESAVYAHDAEKKWIQSHPSILYEMEALKNAMNVITSMFSSPDDPNPIFCYQSLTEEGKKVRIVKDIFSSQAKALLTNGTMWTEDAEKLLQNDALFADKFAYNVTTHSFSEEITISLLADEDFLFLMKQYCKGGLGFEYFARNRRRQAVWKSEAEFRALFQQRIGDDSKAIKTLEYEFDDLAEYCQTKTGRPIVDEGIFEILGTIFFSCIEPEAFLKIRT